MRRITRRGVRGTAAVLVALCAGCGGGPGPAATASVPVVAARAAGGGAARAGGSGSAPRLRARRVRGGPLVEDVGPGAGELVRGPGGVVLLRTPPHGSDAAARAPVEGSPAWIWAPSPLPPPETSGRPVDVFCTPHPDDETLSMGVLIAAAVARGDRVIVVALTDGRTTGAVRDVNARLAATGRGPLDPDAVAAARIGELRRAVADLGVRAGDVVTAHLDTPDSDGGALVTVAEATQVMRALAARYPGATQVTMSDVAEHQQDHLDAGVALHRLQAAGVVPAASWTVSRLWWQQPGPRWTWAVATPAERDAVLRASREYRTWDPADGDYAFGFFSVRWQFAALDRDVRDRVHGTGPTVPGTP